MKDPGWIVFAPPDAQGLLAAAALKRRLELATNGVKLLFPKDLSRRLAAVADEPGEPVPVVADLFPIDSLETLVVPALERFAGRGRAVRWLYGRAEPAPVLRQLAGLIELTYEEGAGAWRLIVGESRDDDFARLADSVQGASSDDGSGWRTVLEALETSWDWPRMYASIDALAELAAASPEDLEWASAQLGEVDEARGVVRSAPTSRAGDRNVAVILDPRVGAQVRPEALRSSRSDVDALVFPTGAARLIVVTTDPGGDLSWLEEQGIKDSEELVVGSLATPRADVVWKPGKIPEPVCALVGDEACEQMANAEMGLEARIERPKDERIAKGLDLARLDPADRAIVEQGLDHRS